MAIQWKAHQPEGLSGEQARLPAGLASWAADWRRSRGRQFPEKPSPTRSEFQRDRDRIIHSTAFRRLAHKTQVFVPHEGDHYRTRLTHTIEVAQIARALARALGLDDDLAEALALAHDLGHTPFGHTGEDALGEVMEAYRGFDHNAQALRIVTRLERHYAQYDGLNLTWETLEGLVKHNGPLLDKDGQPVARYARRGIPIAILEFDERIPLDLSSYASAEAQAAAVADDIAYNAHDIDDGLRAGLFELPDLREIAFIDSLIAEIDALHPGLDQHRVVHELTRRVITRFIEDVIIEGHSRLVASGVRSSDDVRAYGATLVRFSPAMSEVERQLKAFLFTRMYRHPRVVKVRNEAIGVVHNLFIRLFSAPADMPPEWAARALAAPDDMRRARLVCDYIAGMTDRYAVAEHVRLFGSAPSLR
jgi:dGTPase